MNNNFDELILKRRARGRARTASMGAHVLWGAKGGSECLGRRERGGANGRRARTAEGAHDNGALRQRGTPGRGARTCVPPVGGAYGARTAASHVVGGGANVRALQWGPARLK
jgi:hypothetical protein